MPLTLNECVLGLRPKVRQSSMPWPLKQYGILKELCAAAQIQISWTYTPSEIRFHHSNGINMIWQRAEVEALCSANAVTTGPNGLSVLGVDYLFQSVFAHIHFLRPHCGSYRGFDGIRENPLMVFAQQQMADFREVEALERARAAEFTAARQLQLTRKLLLAPIFFVVYIIGVIIIRSIFIFV